MGFSRIVTGPKILCYVNGRVLGTCSSFSYNVSTPHTDIGALDSMVPYELGTTIVRTNGQISVFKRLSDGGAEGLGMSQPIPNLPQGKYFSLMLIEIPTRTIIFQALECTLEAQSWGFDAKGVVRGNFSWKAILYSNEVAPIDS